VVEGDGPAVRAAKRLGDNWWPVEEVSAAKLDAYRAALSLAAAVHTADGSVPLCLQEAGMPKPSAAKSSRHIFKHPARLCVRWERSGAVRSPPEISRLYGRNRGVYGFESTLARHYRESGGAARQLLGRRLE